MLLAVGLPPVQEPLIVQGGDLRLQAVQLRPNADDLQQGLRLVLVAGVHELGQVQRQLAGELVEQLLAGLPPGGVGDLQSAVFACALHGQTVGQGELDPGRYGAALPRGIAGPVALAAQGPADGVQHGRLALGVLPADDGEAVRGGLQREGLDPLDVLDFKRVDSYGHVVSSFF